MWWRFCGMVVVMDRVSDLRSDYEALGFLLAVELDGSKAAALVRERRMVGELLDALEVPKGASVVDQLAARRKPGPGDSGGASRRRKSG